MGENTVEKKKGQGKAKKILLVLLIILAAVIAINYERLFRLHHVITMFEPEVIAENFRSVGEDFDENIVMKGPDEYKFRRDIKKLPETYLSKGKEKNVQNFIKDTDTTGLVVVKGDTILFEEYYNGNNEVSKAIAWSVTKSFVSALFGIAVAEGKIKSIEDSVTDYLPELKESGYNGVRIKDVLQMSSGIAFDEDYADFNSDINRMGRYFALNLPFDDFIKTLKPGRKPGTFNLYVSMDTQVLGMIIAKATGEKLSDYLSEKIWKPVGMESDAIWIIDSDGMEAAFGGLCAVLRDYARFGRLYLDGGNWNGKQIVPEDWVKDSITPDAAHLMPGKRDTADSSMGYGYQWWIPEGGEGDFMAIGVYGQAIYISPKDNIVIARTAAYDEYDEKWEEMEFESIDFFRSIAKQMGAKN